MTLARARMWERLRDGDRLAIVDDTVRTGTSTIDSIDRCRQAGHQVTAVVVLVDREEGGLDRVRAAIGAVPCMALFTHTDLDRRVLGDRGGARPA